MSEGALLHVYGQEAWHDEVRIVGNAYGLLQLRDAITAALSRSVEPYTAAREVSCQDGEGYEVQVEIDDQIGLHPDGSDRRLPPPYTAYYAKGTRPIVRWLMIGGFLARHGEEAAKWSTRIGQDEASAARLVAAECYTRAFWESGYSDARRSYAVDAARLFLKAGAIDQARYWAQERLGDHPLDPWQEEQMRQVLRECEEAETP